MQMLDPRPTFMAKKKNNFRQCTLTYRINSYSRRWPWRIKDWEGCRRLAHSLFRFKISLSLSLHSTLVADTPLPHLATNIHMSQTASHFLKQMGSDDNILLLDKQCDFTEFPCPLMKTRHHSQPQKTRKDRGETQPTCTLERIPILPAWLLKLQGF